MRASRSMLNNSAMNLSGSGGGGGGDSNSSSLNRRTRSASPAMMESTLTAVQAALNRRQLQVCQKLVQLDTRNPNLCTFLGP